MSQSNYVLIQLLKSKQQLGKGLFSSAAYPAWFALVPIPVVSASRSLQGSLGLRNPTAALLPEYPPRQARYPASVPAHFSNSTSHLLLAPQPMFSASADTCQVHTLQDRHVSVRAVVACYRIYTLSYSRNRQVLDLAGIRGSIGTGMPSSQGSARPGLVKGKFPSIWPCSCERLKLV